LTDPEPFFSASGTVFIIEGNNVIIATESHEVKFPLADLAAFLRHLEDVSPPPGDVDGPSRPRFTARG